MEEVGAYLVICSLTCLLAKISYLQGQSAISSHTFLVFDGFGSFLTLRLFLLEGLSPVYKY